MRLLAELDQPDGTMSHYVEELNRILLRKAAGISGLQDCIKTLQRLLHEEGKLVDQTKPLPNGKV